MSYLNEYQITLEEGVQVVTEHLEYVDEWQNPRSWDNLTHMICAHRRYELGDEQYWHEDADTAMDNLIAWFAESGHEYAENLRKNLRKDQLDTFPLIQYEMDEEEETQAQENFQIFYEAIAEHFLCLPINLYDHSGLSLSHGFGSGWDNGVVGWQIAPKTLAEGQMPSPSIREIMEAELKVYAAYVEEDLYQVQVLKGGEEVESVTVYGHHFLKESVDEAVKTAKVWVERERQARIEYEIGMCQNI